MIYYNQTTFRSDGKPFEFERYYSGTLEAYNEDTFKRFGSKHQLKQRLEYFYGVELGKYVRQISSEIIIFFSNKTGLTGKGWAQREWLVCYSETKFWEGQLLYVHPGFRNKLPQSAYRYFYNAMGMEMDSSGYFESFGPNNRTYIYFHGALYTFHKATDAGVIELYKVPLAS